jgi:thiol-disulfide isomerase/thioredoxin
MNKAQIYNPIGMYRRLMVYFYDNPVYTCKCAVIRLCNVYMRKLLLVLLLLSLPYALSARDGYSIKLNFSDLKNTVVRLAHYYGKPAPVYQVDSVALNEQGIGTLATNEKIIGGIYILMLPGNNYFEFLLNNGDAIGITATAANIPASIVYSNSPENERFQKYNLYLQNFALRHQSYQSELAKTASKTEKAAVQDKINKAISEVSNYRINYIKQYPGTLLSNIFKATIMPEAPAGKHYLPSGKVDTLYSFYFIKSHYWDNVDFSDERLVYTPVLGSRYHDFLTNYTVHTADSAAKAVDLLLDKAKANLEIKKYTLSWLSQYALESNIMGMDELFVYIVENYYMKGYADWMSKDLLDKYAKRAQEIAPNVIGNKAPEIRMVDMDNNEIPMSYIDAKYTLLIFWAPDCGGCTREVPIIDSIYRNRLKAKGVRIYAVNIDVNKDQWSKVIKEKKLSDDWIHVYDPEQKSTYKADYDVYATPSIYLLDKNKIIRGKRLDHTNISYLVDILERSNNSN